MGKTGIKKYNKSEEKFKKKKKEKRENKRLGIGGMRPYFCLCLKCLTLLLGCKNGVRA